VATVVDLAGTLDEMLLERVLLLVTGLELDSKLVFDARHTTWASPYGLTALLALGSTRLVRPTFLVPENDDIRAYWTRCAFFRQADLLFDLIGKFRRESLMSESSVLLEITRIDGEGIVHDLVARVQAKAAEILTDELKLGTNAPIGFAMSLVEVCQNILDHAESPGWASVAVYNWRKRLGRKVAVIAVADAGRGFRASMASVRALSTLQEFDDAAALELAVDGGVSRLSQPGRGQGLAAVGSYVKEWAGKLSVRSGTARIALVPRWDDGEKLVSGLAQFAGAQIQMVIPARA
jgi:hypothetical protein